MTVTITAVSASPGGIDPAPAPSPPVERSLADFVADLQAGGGLPNLANPGALSSELVGKLRGYFERAQRIEKMRMSQSGPEGVAGQAASSSVTAAPQGTPRHGGPARESLEPEGGESGVSPAVGLSLEQLHRAMDLALTSMNFATETTLVVRGVSQISHSANTLLKGQ